MSERLQQLFFRYWRTALAALLLFVITVGIFWPATGYDFINFDDDRYVAGNQIVLRGLTAESIRWASRAVYESYWLPVMWLSYMVDASVFGAGAFGFHLTNVLLHALNAALLLLLLRVMTGRFWPSLFVAAFFAWHPLRVESVAWIAERKDVLSGLWFMLSLFCYAWFSRRPVSGRDVPAALFMALGLMTKPILVTLPFLLLLLDYWPLQRWSLGKADPRPRWMGLIGEKVLFWSLSLLFCLLTYYTQKLGNAIHGTDSIPWGQRLSDIPAAYLFYLQKTILPLHLQMIYGDVTASPYVSLGSALVLIIATAWVLKAGRRCGALPVGWFWFLGLLVPVIGLVRVGTVQVADRFTYLPSIGLGLCLAWGAAWLAPRWRWREALLGILAVAVLAGCVWQTRRTLPHWATSITAFENVLQGLPDNALANNNYGDALLGTGQTDVALRHFRKAMAKDSNTTPFIANAGMALVLLNRTDEALALTKRALVEKNPRCPFLNFVHGIAWVEKGAPEQAIPYLKRAIADSADRPTWRMELTRAYLESGQMAAASNEFRAVNEAGWPALATFEGMCNYYAALWQKGHGQRASTFFERTLAVHSNDVMMLNNVAWLLATDPPLGATNASGEAIYYALRAKDLSGEAHPTILDTLSVAYAADGQTDQAIYWAEKARAQAQTNHQAALAAKIAIRIEAYKQGKAWRRTGAVEY